MHTKPVNAKAFKQQSNVVDNKSPKIDKLSVLNRKMVEEDFPSDESWWAEEVIKREIPHAEALEKQLQQTLHSSPDLFITHCPELTQRLANEITRSSRQEPGGVKSCRLLLNIIPKVEQIPEQPHNDVTNDSARLFVGSVTRSDEVPTFEIYVYLFPCTSALSWLQAYVTSLSSAKARPTSRGRPKVVSLAKDFVIVKRKLFRSRSANAKIVRTSSFN